MKTAWRRYAVWILLLPFAGTLFPAVYNRPEPALFGMPFFYWYQLSWVVITTVLLGIVVFAGGQRDDV
jgi:Protein of unknown function (DUF3311)